MPPRRAWALHPVLVHKSRMGRCGRAFLRGNCPRPRRRWEAGPSSLPFPRPLNGGCRRARTSVVTSWGGRPRTGSTRLLVRLESPFLAPPCAPAPGPGLAAERRALYRRRRNVLQPRQAFCSSPYKPGTCPSLWLCPCSSPCLKHLPNRSAPSLFIQTGSSVKAVSSAASPGSLPASDAASPGSLPASDAFW